MSPHNRVHRINRIPPRNAAPVETIINLLAPRMHSSKPMQSALELWRKPLVSLGHIAEQRIAACRRAVKQIQECSSWRLVFECYIRVPCY